VRAECQTVSRVATSATSLAAAIAEAASAADARFELWSFFAWWKNYPFKRRREGTAVGTTQMPLHIQIVPFNQQREY